ncbi:uncharacterized protein LOC144567707 [Carex rostrata]
MAFVKRACKYVVKFGDARAVTCTCQGPQLSHIPCSHVMAVCRVRNYCEDHYVADMYRTDYLASTWGGSFHSYPDQHEWPTYVGDRILPSEGWIRKGRRRHKRIVMTMDEMGGRRPSGNRARRSVSDRRRADAINEHNERENARVVAEATGRTQPPPPVSQSSSSQASTSNAAPATGTRRTSRLLGLFRRGGR